MVYCIKKVSYYTVTATARVYTLPPPTYIHTQVIDLNANGRYLLYNEEYSCDLLMYCSGCICTKITK